MGYNITIGELRVEYYQAERHIRLDAEEVTLDEAPAFNEPTDHKNIRWPSYTAWSNFLEEVGLSELFYEGGRVIGGHPGVCPLTQEWADKVHAARLHREATNGGKPAGFHGESFTNGKYECIDNGKDPQLARLIWLDFWCGWAMKNCKQPVIANS